MPENNGLSRDTFDYATYLTNVVGADPEKVDTLYKTDEQRKTIYDDAVKRSYQEFVGKAKSTKSKIDAARKTIDMFDDGRSVLGIPEVDQEEDRPFKKETFLSFLEKDVPEKYRDADISNVVDDYRKGIQDHPFSEFKYPRIGVLGKDGFNDLLQKNVGDLKGRTINDVIADLSRKDDKKNDPLTGDVEKDTDLLIDQTTGNHVLDEDGNKIKLDSEDRDSAIEFGIDQAQKMFASGLIDIGTLFGKDSKVGKNIKEFGQSYEKEQDEDIKYGGYVQKYKKGLVDTIYEEGVMSFFPWLAEKMQENAASSGMVLGGMTAAAATGGLAGLGIAAGTMATGTVMSTGEVRNELVDKGVWEEDDALMALGGGVLIQGLDLIGAVRTVPGLKAGLIKTFAEKGLVKKLGAKYVEEVAPDLVKKYGVKEAAKKLTMKEAYKKAASATKKESLKRAVVSEAGTEVAQEFVSIGSAWINGAEYKPSEVVKRVVDTAVVSGAFGASTHIAGSTLKKTDTKVSDEIDVTTQGAPFTTNTDEGSVVFVNGEKAVGETHADALRSLRDNTQKTENKSKQENTEKRKKRYSTKSKDGLSSQYLDEELNIKFNGKDAQSSLNEILNNDDFTYNGKFGITKKEDGTFIVESNGKTSENKDVIKAIEEVSRVDDSNNIKIIPVQETKADDVEINISRNDNGRDVVGLRPVNERVLSDLESSGFEILSDIGEKGSTKFTAYKDGYIYSVSIPTRKKVKSRIANVTIKDVFGNKVHIPDNISTQAIRGVKGESLRNSITLPSPLKGVRIHSVDVSGGNKTLIDPAAVDDFASKINAKVDIVKPDFASIYHPESKKYSVFKVRSDGKIVASMYGSEPVSIDGNFKIVDTNHKNVSTMAVEAQKIIDDGGKVVSAENGDIVLEKHDGGKVTISKVDNGIEIKDGKSSRNISTKEEPVSSKTEPSQDNDFSSSRKFTLKYSTVPDSIIKIKDTIYRNNKNLYVGDKKTGEVIVDGGGDTVVIAENGGVLDRLKMSMGLFNLRSVANSTSGSDHEGFIWTKTDIENFVKASLPKKIADIIVIHDSIANPAAIEGNSGIFIPVGKSGNPEIHIDASHANNGSMHDVLQTISEEVAHFSFDSWFVPEVSELVEIAFSIAKQQIIKGLGKYIHADNIDINNPTIQEKWLLVNEFFSKQGTSILDFKSNQVDLPPGVTQSRLEKLKKSIVGKIVNENVTIGSTADSFSSKEFVESILRLQAGGVLGKQAVLHFSKDNISGTGRQSINVYSMPVGKRVVTHGEGREAIRIQNQKKRYDSIKGFKRKRAYKWLLNNGFGFFFTDSPLGNEVVGLIGGAYKAASAAVSDSLRFAHTGTLRVNAMLHEHGIDGMTIDDSYYEKLLAAGETDKKRLNLALDLDEFMQSAVELQFDNVAQIRQAFREASEILEGLLDNEPGKNPDLAKNVARYRQELEAQARRFVVDWTHRRYYAFTDEGIKEVNEMLNAVKGNGDNDTIDLQTYKDAKIASDKIASIKKSIANGSISKKKGNIQIVELNKIVKRVDRIESLIEWGKQTLDRRGIPRESSSYNRKLYAILKEKMEGIIGENEIRRTTSGAGQKLELISSAMSRKLDWEDPHDQLLVKFLDPITDPLENYIVNLDQQTKIIAALRFNNELAVKMIENGYARLIGSRLNESEFSPKNADRSTGVFQKGTLLRFIEINPFYSDFINKELSLNAQIRDVALGQVVGFIKQGYTKFSSKLLLNNFWGNLPVTLEGGYFFTHLSTLNEAGGLVRDGFKTRLNIGKKGDGTTRAEMLMREMVDLRVIDSSWNQLEMDLSKNDVIESFIDKSLGIVENGGLISKERRILAVSKFKSFLDTLGSLYGYGDDYAKLLPYIINRNLGMLRAETIIFRENFESGTSGDLEFERALVKEATTYAATRTLRDSTNWVVASHFIRKISSARSTFFFSNWMMFPAQMSKILTENKKIIYEDFKEVKVQRSLGNNEYADALKGRAVARTAGNMIGMAGRAGLAVKGYGTATALIAGLLALANGENDDNDKKDGRDSQFTSKEFLAAQRLLTHVVYSGWSVNYPLPFGKTKDSMLVWNGHRSAATNAFAQVKPLTDEGVLSPDIMKVYLKNLAGNFFATDPTISHTLLNLFQGMDDQGHGLTEREWSLKLAELASPAAVDSAFIGFTGHTIEGREKDRLNHLIGDFTGFGVKRVYFPEEMNKVAYELKTLLYSKDNPTAKETIDRVSVGEKLNDSDIHSILSGELTDNKQAMARLRASVKVFRDLHYSDDEIMKWMTNRARGEAGNTGFPKWAVEMALTGKSRVDGVTRTGNPFDYGILTSLYSKKKYLKKAKPSSGETSRWLNYEQLKNARLNVDLAIRKLEEYIQNNQ